jgi:hypothetical protein
MRRLTLITVGIFFCFGLQLFVAPAKALADVYIAQVASGSGNGSSCSNAEPYTFFNLSSNWGSGKPIAPGSTVHLCGTFTGTAGEELLIAQGSGTSGSPITIHFESGALLTAPYWSASGAINIGSKSYITIDGGTNGAIQNTANGTSPTYQYQQQSRGIYAASCTGCIVQNITIANLYVHNSMSDTSINQQAVNCVYYNNSTNVTINNMTCHDAGWAVTGPATNLTLENSNIYNCDHGLAFGANTNVGGLDIHNNHIHDFANWDTTNNAYHHDYLHLWNNGSGTFITSAVIYNNMFDGVFGNCCTTAHIYLEYNIEDVWIFNNTFIESSADATGRIGIEMAANGGGFVGKNNYVLNNYFSMGAHNSGNPIFAHDGQSGLVSENNIVIGGQYDTSVEGGSSISVIDYNLYDDLYKDYGNLTTFQWLTNSPTHDFATWKSQCHCDAHSLLDTNAQINVDSNGVPQSGSAAFNNGTNLTSLATGTHAPLSKDKNGSARPSTGPWTIGAYN